MDINNKNNTTLNQLQTLFIDSNCMEGVNTLLKHWFDASQSILLQTSGSTGEKKIIDAQKKYLLESARMTGEFFNFNSEMTALICLPLNFISGNMMLVRCLEFGMLSVICMPNNPFAYPDDLEIDFAAMTPYQYEKALNENPTRLTQIKTILLGGAPVSEQLKIKILDAGHQVYHSYGMTETYSHIALKHIVNQNNAFEILPGISCKQAEDKTLIISAPFLGIDELKTNDIVLFESPSKFHFLGRKDFVVNSAGIKLHPEELEKKVSTLNLNFNFFFFGLPDETFGEKLVLFVETQEKLDTNRLHDVLGKYEIPKSILYCEKFIYTDSGKINRIQTAKKYTF
jgi:o-succinylbenzoate---CoA ligase